MLWPGTPNCRAASPLSAAKEVREPAVTQNLEGHRGSSAEEPERPTRRHPVEHIRWPWYRSPWVIGTAVLVVFNLVHALPRYLSLDPAMSRSAIDPTFALHYPVLVVHVVTGNIAMITVFLQILPWLRQRSVRFHKISGMVYICGGAIPSALLALVLLPYSQAPTGKVGLFAMAVAWIATTVAGFRAQAGHRYPDHRRWMVYSFAIALGTSWGRVLGLAMQEIPGIKIDMMVFIETSSWLWVGNVLVAHWWLQRRSRRNKARASLQPTT